MDNQMNEIDILTTLFCKNKEFHPYIIKIDEDYFSKENQTFFATFKKYYTQYGKPPSQAVLQTELSGDNLKSALDIFEAIKQNYLSLKNMDQTYLTDKVNIFVKKSFIKKMLIQSFDFFKEGEYDQIIKNFQRINESIIDTDMGRLYYDPEFFIKKYERDKSGTAIKSGSSQFDSTFDGFHRKSLTVIAGPSNSGKTMFLTNLTAMMLGLNDEVKNILYITLEIDEEQIGKRIDASLLGEPIKSLGRKILSETESESLIQRFGNAMNKGNRLVIKAMKSGSTPADISALIRNLSSVPLKGTERVFKPDVVLVDYMGLLKPNYVTKNMNTYEKGRDISEDLRTISQEFNLAIVAAAQTNRNSFGNEVTQESISDSIAIAQTADLMLTINRNEELDNMNQVMIYLAKSRYSRNGVKFLFSADYDCMRLNDIDTGRITDDTTERL